MSIERAVVLQQDPDNYAVYVAVLGRFGGQGPALAAQVGTHGPRDAVRGSYPELPTPGTHGLVAYSSGDTRNLVWLCSTRSQLTDASGHGPGKGGEAHAAHWGGGWSRRGMDGAWTEAFPDGSVLSLGSPATVPTRHTLDGSQARQRTAFAAAQRVAHAPAAFPVRLSHPSGAQAALSSAGAWSLTAASGQPLTVAVAGGASVTINADGSVAISSPAAVTVTAATAVNLRAPSISASNGGLTAPLRRSDNSITTVLTAQ